MEKTCTALVCSRNADDRTTTFNVHFLNKELADMLPAEIVFNLRNGVVSPDQLEDKLAEELVQKTTDAISHYLQDHT